MDLALLEKILRSQQEQFLQAQSNWNFNWTVSNQTNNREEKCEFQWWHSQLNNRIPVQPGDKTDIASWFSCCEDIFWHEFHSQDEEWKLRLLLRKLGTKEYQRYKHFILPKTLGDFTLTETVAQLTDIFSELSLFNTRYNCLKLKKDDNEDFFRLCWESKFAMREFSTEIADRGPI